MEEKKPEQAISENADKKIKYVTITKIVILGVFSVGLLIGVLIGYFFRATGL